MSVSLSCFILSGYPTEFSLYFRFQWSTWYMLSYSYTFLSFSFLFYSFLSFSLTYFVTIGIIADYTVSLTNGISADLLTSRIVNSALEVSTAMSATFPFSVMTSAGSLTGEGKWNMCKSSCHWRIQRDLWRMKSEQKEVKGK